MIHYQYSLFDLSWFVTGPHTMCIYFRLFWEKSSQDLMMAVTILKKKNGSG